MTDDGSAPRAARLQQHPGTEAWTHADSLLQNTWVKRDAHEFLKLLSVEEVDNPTLGQRYDNYKLSLTSLDGSTLPNGNEQLVFHGCAADAIPSILANGFQKKFWKSAAGDWQRFGPGFYFALQVSKSELASRPTIICGMDCCWHRFDRYMRALNRRLRATSTRWARCARCLQESTPEP